jgi:hypothetical protein
MEERVTYGRCCPGVHLHKNCSRKRPGLGEYRFPLNKCQNKSNILYYVRVTDHFWPHQLNRVWVLETPFWVLILFYLQSQTFVTTITHNYLLRFCAFTQLKSLHANIPFYSLTVFITHLTSSHVHTSRVCLPSRTHSSKWLLKNWLCMADGLQDNSTARTLRKRSLYSSLLAIS